MSSAKRLTVRVRLDVAMRGHAYPCSMRYCGAQATRALVLEVAGVACHAWVCREHRAAFGVVEPWSAPAPAGGLHAGS